MRKTILLVLVTIVSLTAYAQEKTITGIVTDETGPLPGTTIIVKGTTNGTETDFDGKYTIKAKVGDILVYRFIGYKTEEKTVGASSIINVLLAESGSTLDEVVVMGMGTTRRRKSVGYSVSTISSEEISTTGDKPKAYDTPQSGQLTAGEINDLNKWKEWLKIKKTNKDFAQVRNDWHLFIEDKIIVSVNSEDNKPINNAMVYLLDKNLEVIDKGMTDVFGKVAVFKKDRKRKAYIIQVSHNNNVKGTRITDKHQKIAFEFKNKESQNTIDVMFTIDATGSMGDEISYLKSEIENIITRVDTSIQQKRIGLTFYRDKTDAYLVRDFDFSTDIANIKENLSNQNADGGGDYEEAVEEALKVSFSKSWNKNAKTRLLFLLLDAPPHLNQENIATIKKQLNIAKEKGIKIIPIVASGANKTVEFLMRYFSVTTNGTYVFLTDDSGIGNPHLKPSTSDLKIEKLNDLIVRLIEKYAGVKKAA